MESLKSDSNLLTFVCLSDTHSQHNKIKSLPPGDVLLHTGDFTYHGKRNEVENFNDWLGKIATIYKHRVVIAGNHEITFDIEHENFLKPRFFGCQDDFKFQDIKDILTNCTYLEHQSTEIEGIKIFGTPYQPWFHDWGFNRSPQELEKLMNEIPEDSDIVLTHGPPKGILD